jgi:hypothetical protein
MVPPKIVICPIVGRAESRSIRLVDEFSALPSVASRLPAAATMRGCGDAKPPAPSEEGRFPWGSS